MQCCLNGDKYIGHSQRQGLPSCLATLPACRQNTDHNVMIGRPTAATQACYTPHVLLYTECFSWLDYGYCLVNHLFFSSDCCLWYDQVGNNCCREEVGYFARLYNYTLWYALSILCVVSNVMYIWAVATCYGDLIPVSVLDIMHAQSVQVADLPQLGSIAHLASSSVSLRWQHLVQ